MRIFLNKRQTKKPRAFRTVHTIEKPHSCQHRPLFPCRRSGRSPREMSLYATDDLYIVFHRVNRKNRLRTKLMKMLIGAEKKKISRKSPYCSSRNTVRSRSGTSA